MAKSVNEYYSEKMKKLLEMQNNGTQGRLSAPRSNGEGSVRSDTQGGRGYYDKFRTRVGNERTAAFSASGSGTQKSSKSGQNPLKKTVIDDLRRGQAPSKNDFRRRAENKTGHESSGEEGGKDTAKKKRISPEQTARDKYEENLRRIEAIRTAKRARILRKVRDGVVSCVLIMAVFVLMCVVVYRLLFVIKDISAVGGVENTAEELVLASGVSEGDHLFSFSSREVGELMMLRCPEIATVDVERTPPGTIVFNVTEEEPCFYADFYGEYRLLTSSLRVMGSVTEEDAKALGCIKIKLPDVRNVTAGLTPEFSSVRSDEYIYEICRALIASKLGDRAVSIDVSDKYNITAGIDGKYLVKLGEAENTEIKLNIADAVLADEMFKKDIKATVDVSDLSETSVIVDDGLKIE